MRATKTVVVAIAMFTSTLGACSSAATPPGFVEGPTWWMPLLGALGDGMPIAPATINGKASYFFVLDPSRPSSIAPWVANEIGLFDPQRKAQADADSRADGDPDAPRQAYITQLQSGSFKLVQFRMPIQPTRHMYHGRKIAGIFGREVFADTLVWTVDRDRQYAELTVHGRAKTPKVAPIQLRVEGRARFATVTLDDDHTVELRIDTGSASMLSPAQARAAELRALDERAWLADSVQIGGASAYEQLFTAAESEPVGLEGVLGKGFFANFRLTMSMTDQAMWLEPRGDDPLELTTHRLTRWGPNRFADCEQPACLTLTVTDAATAAALGPDPESAASDDARDDSANNAARDDVTSDNAADAATGADDDAAADDAVADEDALVLIVERDESQRGDEYDFLLASFDEVDTPLPAPYLLVTMPKDITRIVLDLGAIGSAYLRAASFRVVDATPYPLPCTSQRGCVWLQR